MQLPEDARVIRLKFAGRCRNCGLLQMIAEEAGFDSDDLRRRGIHHKSGSAYFAFEHPAGKSAAPVLLNEHYRCHPHIARWRQAGFRYYPCSASAQPL